MLVSKYLVLRNLWILVPISQFVFVAWVFCSLVSICFLIFCFMWPMVEQVLSSQVRAGNLTDGVAFAPAGSVCPCLGLKGGEERVGNLEIVLKGTERMRKVSWKVAYIEFLQIVCGSPPQRRGGKWDWG